MSFAEWFEQALPYEEFLQRHGSEQDRRAWDAVRSRIVLSESQRALVAGFPRQMKILCLAGAWCGDCVEQCPILACIAACNPCIDLRFLERDAHPEAAAALRVCGGARVPVVVFLSEDGHECARFGDRTLSRYRWLAARQLGAQYPGGPAPADDTLMAAVTQEWLNEFERVQLMLRTSARLRQLHGD
jgi:thiol-disulfide isomerase/thioredoxin